MKISNYKTYLFSFLVALFLCACSENKEEVIEPISFEEIDWTDLDPNGDAIVEYSTLESLGLNDEFASEYEESFDLKGGYAQIPTQAYSVGVVEDINGKNVRVPGFIVPVEFDNEGLVSGFFLVPYFGACFHEPPPPPNQTIYITTDKPIKVESIYDPIWAMGTIKTEQTGNDIATAAYKMDLSAHEPYTEHY